MSQPVAAAQLVLVTAAEGRTLVGEGNFAATLPLAATGKALAALVALLCTALLCTALTCRVSVCMCSKRSLGNTHGLHRYACDDCQSAEKLVTLSLLGLYI